MYPIVEGICNQLRLHSNPEHAVQMKRYMKSEMPFYGVQAKLRQELFKPLAKKYPPASLEEYLEVISQLWALEHREEKYLAIMYARRFKKLQVMEALPQYTRMIQEGAWWDFVDEIASNLIGALLKQYPQEMKSQLNAWIDHEDIWLRRTAILAQLKFKQKTDEKLLFKFCREHLDEESFWIRKAIGWALREHSKTNPQAVSRFIDQYKLNMSNLTLREASKYI
ncbi:DNA alkylation repair protein [bacterium]|nr:DNA alkylation repair protein [bacterium]